MSKVSAKINKMVRELESISGLDGDFVYGEICYVDDILSKAIRKVREYEAQDELNGTIFEDLKS